MFLSLSLSLRGGGELVDYFDTVCNSDLVEFLKQRAEEDGYVYIPTNIHHSGPTYTTVDQHTPQCNFLSCGQKVSYTKYNGPATQLQEMHIIPMVVCTIISCIKVGETFLSRNKVVPVCWPQQYVETHVFTIADPSDLGRQTDY